MNDGESKIQRHKSQGNNAKQNNRKTVTKEPQSSSMRGEVGGKNQNRNTETQSRDWQWLSGYTMYTCWLMGWVVEQELRDEKQETSTNEELDEKWVMWADAVLYHRLWPSWWAHRHQHLWPSWWPHTIISICDTHGGHSLSSSVSVSASETVRWPVYI